MPLITLVPYGDYTGEPAPKRTYSDKWNSLKIGLQQLPGTATALADLAPALAFGKTPFSQAAEALGEFTGIEPARWAEENQRNYSPEYWKQQGEVGQVWDENVVADQGIMRQVWDVIRSSPQLAAAYASNPSYTINQVIQSLPSMAAGGVVGRGLMAVGGRSAGGVTTGALERGVGTRWASPIAGGAGEGAVATGQAMDQTMDTLGPDAAPGDVRRAAEASLAAGAFDLLINAGGGRVAQRFGLETPETLIAGGRRVPNVARNAAGEALYDAAGNPVMQGRRFLPRLAGGAVAESLQEFPQSLQEGGFQNIAEGRDFTDSGPEGHGLMRQGIEGALAGIVMGAGANVLGRGRTTTGRTAGEVEADSWRGSLTRGAPTDLLAGQMPTQQPELDFGATGYGSNRPEMLGPGETVSPTVDPAAAQAENQRRAAVYRAVLNSSSFDPEQKAQAQEALNRLEPPTTYPETDTGQGDMFAPRPAPTPALSLQGQGQQGELGLSGNEVDASGTVNPYMVGQQGAVEAGQAPGSATDMFSGERRAVQDSKSQPSRETRSFLEALAVGDLSAMSSIGYKAADAVGKVEQFAELLKKVGTKFSQEGQGELFNPERDEAIRQMVEIVQEGEAALADPRRAEQRRTADLEKAAIYRKILASTAATPAQKAQAAEALEELGTPSPGIPVRQPEQSDAVRKSLFDKAMGGKENVRLMDRLVAEGKTAMASAAEKIAKLRKSKKGGVKEIADKTQMLMGMLKAQFDEALGKKQFGKMIALQRQMELADAKTGEAVEGLSTELPQEPPSASRTQEELSDRAIELWRHGVVSNEEVEQIFAHLGTEHYERARPLIEAAAAKRAEESVQREQAFNRSLARMREELQDRTSTGAGKDNVLLIDWDYVDDIVDEIEKELERGNSFYGRRYLGMLMNVARYRYGDRDALLAKDIKARLVDSLQTAEHAELEIEHLKSEEVVSAVDVIAAQNISRRMDEGSGSDIDGFTEAGDRRVRNFLAGLPKVDFDEDNPDPMRVLNRAALRLSREKGGEFESEFEADTELKLNKESGQEEKVVTRKAVDKLVRYILDEFGFYGQLFGTMAAEDRKFQIEDMATRFGPEVLEVVTRYMEVNPMVRHARNVFADPSYWARGDIKSTRVPSGKLISGSKVVEEGGRAVLAKDSDTTAREVVAGLVGVLQSQHDNPDTMDRRENLWMRLRELYSSAGLRGEGRTKPLFYRFVVAILASPSGTHHYTGTSPEGKKTTEEIRILISHLLNTKADKALGQWAANVRDFGQKLQDDAAAKRKANERAPGTAAEAPPTPPTPKAKETSAEVAAREDPDATFFVDDDGAPKKVEVRGTAEKISGHIIITNFEVENVVGEPYVEVSFDKLNDMPAGEVLAALKKRGVVGKDVEALKAQVEKLLDTDAKIAAKKKAENAAVTTSIAVGDTKLETSTPKFIEQTMGLWDSETGKWAGAGTRVPPNTAVALKWLAGNPARHTLPAARKVAGGLGLKPQGQSAETIVRQIMFELEQRAGQARLKAELKGNEKKRPGAKPLRAPKKAASTNLNEIKESENERKAPLPRSNLSEARQAGQAARDERETTRVPDGKKERLIRYERAAIDFLEDATQHTIGRARKMAYKFGIVVRPKATVEGILRRIDAKVKRSEAARKGVTGTVRKVRRGEVVYVPVDKADAARDARNAEDIITEKKEALQPITGRRSFIRAVLGLIAGAVLPQSRAMAANFASTVRAGDSTAVLQLIASGSSNPAFRTLARKLLALKTPVRLRVVEVGQVGPASLNSAAGITRLTSSTDLGNNKVEIFLRGDIGVNEQTVLHEMIHAVLQARYSTLSTYLANKSLQGRNADPALKLLLSVWREFQKEVAKTFPDRKALDAAPIGVKEAATDIDEFLTYAMTDPETQEWMRSRMYKGQTLWGRFKEFVKGVLGFGATEPSWLDAALRVGNEVLDAAAADQPDFKAGQAVARARRDGTQVKREERDLTDALYGLAQHSNGDLTNHAVHLKHGERFGEFEGQPVVGYAITSPDGVYLGQLTAVIGPNGTPSHIMLIQIGESMEQPERGSQYDMKNTGWGSKVIRAILEASPLNTVVAVDVVPSAVPIYKSWNARWPSSQLEHGNAYLTLDAFENRRDPNANPWRDAEMEEAGGRDGRSDGRRGEELEELDFTQTFKSQALAPIPFALRPAYAPIFAQIKAAFNGAVRLFAPMADIAEMMERAGMKTAAVFMKSFEKRLATQRQWEMAGERIGQEFQKLPYDEQPKLDTFLGRSTLDGWGYQPTWLRDDADNVIPVAIHDGARELHEGLSPEAQAIADRMFQYNDDMWRQKNELINQTIRDGFEGERQDAAGDAKKLSEIGKRERAEIAKYGKKLPRMLDKPYSPLKRFGKHAITGRSAEFKALEDEYNDPDTPRERKGELATALRTMKGDPKHYEVQFRDWKISADMLKGEVAARFPDGHVEVFERSTLAESQHYELPYHVLARLKSEIDDLGLATNTTNSLQRAASNLYVEMLSQANARKNEMERLGVAGYGEMMQSFVSQARADASLLSTLSNNRDILNSLRDMRREVAKSAPADKDRRSSLYNEVARRYLNTIHYNDSTWQQKAMRGNSVMLLITSPMYLMANASQVYMMSLPKLAANFGWAKTADLINKTYGELGVGSMLIADDIDLDKITRLYGADVGLALGELQEAGQIDITIMQEIGKWAESGMMPTTDFGRWIRENKITAATGRGLTFAANMPQRVEMMNRIVTGIVAYRMKMESLATREKPEGMSAKEFAALNHEKGVGFAKKIIGETQGAYDEAHAGRIFQQGDSVLPVKLLLQFRKFQIIQLSFMIRDFVRAYSGNKPGNLTTAEWAEEKAVAKRALAFAMAHYGAMTGALGLPFAGMVMGAFAALGAGSDDDDEPRASWLAATPFATSEDRQLTELWARNQLGGGSLATLLTRGIPTLVGVDLTASVGAGTATSMLPYAKKGRDATETAVNTAFSMLGATSGTIQRLTRSADYMAKGDYLKGLEQGMPSGPGNAMQGLRESLQGKTDKTGTILTPAEDVSAWESAWKMLGGRTTQETERNILQQKIITTEQHYTARRKELGDAFVEAKREGDGARAAEIRREWMRLAASMRAQGLKAPQLSALANYWKREQEDQKRVIGGVVTKRSNRELALRGI